MTRLVAALAALLSLASIPVLSDLEVLAGVVPDWDWVRLRSVEVER